MCVSFKGRAAEEEEGNEENSLQGRGCHHQSATQYQLSRGVGTHPPLAFRGSIHKPELTNVIPASFTHRDAAQINFGVDLVWPSHL